MNAPNLTRNELERLIASDGGPHLSLYLPPPITGNDTLEEEKIRLGNLVRSARDLLTEHWISAAEADAFLRPLKPLIANLFQPNPRRYSIAAFVCSQSHDVFRVAHETKEQLTIARSFRVRPLLPCLDETDPYVVVTLSRQRVAMYARTREGLERVTGVMPERFAEIEAEMMGESQPGATVVGGRGRQAMVYHGQGDTRDVEKVDLENYLKHIDDSICTYLRRHVGVRLILAGVDSLTAMYQANSHCQSIVEHTLSGNVDHLSTAELQARIESAAGDELHEQRKRKGVRIHEHDVPVATDPEQVLVAANEGRIDTLFIDQDARLNGSFLAEQGTLKEVHREPTGVPSDSCHDLIELAAVQTIKNRGMVYVVTARDMPVAQSMAAALRY